MAIDANNPCTKRQRQHTPWLPCNERSVERAHEAVMLIDTSLVSAHDPKCNQPRYAASQPFPVSSILE